MNRAMFSIAKTAVVLATSAAFLQYCALPIAAAVPFSFGWNNSGRTGLGTEAGITISANPIDTKNLGNRNVTQVAAGGLHSLLLTDDGTVFSVGGNYSGELGSGRVGGVTTIAAPIDTTNLGGYRIVQVAAGSGQSLLLTDDGTVFSFGTNGSGLTGLGTTSGRTPVATPIDATNLTGRMITQVETGSLHGLLLANDGTVFSFGNNLGGRTGMGTETGITTIATPIDTTNLTGLRVNALSAGGSHSLLIADDGTVLSFGNNMNGQTGLGTTSGVTTVATPIDMTNLAGKRITQVATGVLHSLLLADDGTVFSFGSNQYGQTGLGTTSGNTLIATPILTTNLMGKRITRVEAGDFHSLLLADDGTVFSFGSNLYGQSGQGTFTTSTNIATPINTVNLAGLRVTSISGGNSHSLLLAVPEPNTLALVVLAVITFAGLPRSQGGQK